MLPLAAWLVATQFTDGAWNLCWRPMGLLALSYLLQWIGHAVEGNDMGEVILLKKLLGRPYVAVSSRYLNTDESRPAPLEAAVCP